MPRLTLGSRLFTVTGGTQEERNVLLFDGVEVEGNHYYPYDHQGKISVNIYETDLEDQLSDLRVRDVLENVHHLGIAPSPEHEQEENFLTVANDFGIFRPHEDDVPLVFAVTIDFAWHRWNRPWSPADALEEMEIVGLDFPEIRQVYGGPHDSDDYQAIVEFPFNNLDRRVLDELEDNYEVTKRFVEAVEKSLQAKLNENSLLNYFNFHPAVQGPCEEYLWSFIQFLKDVGMEATAELKQDQNDPHKVLFSVTPTRGKAVLGKIKQALDLYISLAGASQFEFDANASLQSERLESRLLFFQSQLKTASLEARLQEATIQAHEATIRAQGTSLDRVNASNVFLLARVDELEREKEKKAKDEREFFGGIIRLGNWNTKGFIVNVPRLLDAVKGVMAEDEIIPASIKRELDSVSETPALPSQQDEK